MESRKYMETYKRLEGGKQLETKRRIWQIFCSRCGRSGRKERNVTVENKNDNFRYVSKPNRKRTSPNRENIRFTGLKVLLVMNWMMDKFS